MPWPKATPIELTDAERTKLESIVRKATAPQRSVFRAQIILKAAQGLGNRTIAKALNTIPKIVRIWRKRFGRKRIEALEDKPRSGRPLTFSL